MFRKPSFWVALTGVAIVSAVLALRLFPQAFPIVHLDLTMDREGALTAARDLTARTGIGPTDYREAASFSTDSQAQTFIELEGGGKAVFAEMLRAGTYAAHTWRVRHFQEGEKHEALIRFRTDGRPYGFAEQIDESAPGKALTPDEARAIAERAAADTWLVDLPAFSIVEQSREERATGRVDHAFTYERSSPTLNEGRYRLRLGVTGDRLTEVTHFIRIPQAFTRRYEAMRSANEAIGAAGSVAMIVLYIVGGIGVGLFWLLRHRFVVAAPAIRWGVGVAALQLLAGLNEFPLLWMSYDTALPRASFISQHLTSLLAAFAGFATLFSFSFMAAESLGRRAFGHHPQLWRVWSTPAASSYTVLGSTLAGLLAVSVFFGYDVLLYLYATRWFQWWSPADALIHPDILATYLPWLSAIANSLQAGFWEEALFRAVPIAGAALIGDRFGKRTLFIIIAFVVQTVVFGAGHAPYPTQPSYARPVELILPSIGFGLIYLRFGLLPGIILHYVFDVVWFALPLFVSTASGIWFDRTMVIALALAPLGIVLAARVRTGTWRELAPEERNAAWTPIAPREPAASLPAAAVALPLSSRVMGIWWLVGAVALIGWLMLQPFRTIVPPLDVTQADAERIAREALSARGVAVGAIWRVLPIVDSGRSEAHQFVWEVAGRERFQSLLGRYLPTPRWRVRVAMFEGSLIDRAEEWVVLIGRGGEVDRIIHQLPESRAAITITEEEARVRAVAEIERLFALRATDLREVSARPAKLSARTDWTFTFQDLTVEPILLGAPGGSTASADNEARGEARIEVVIAGDEIARVRPFLRVPEIWQRQQRARATLAQIVSLVAMLIAGSALASGALTGVTAWSRRRGFSRRVLVLTFLAFVVPSLIAAVNRLPATVATLSTAQSVALQMAMLLGVGLIGLLLPGALLALAAGTFPSDMPARRLMTSRQHLALAVSLAALAVAAGVIGGSGTPPWPDVSELGSFVPLVGGMLDPIPGLLLRSVIMLALLTMIDDFTDGWTSRRMVFGVLLFIAGAVLGTSANSLSVSQWMVGAGLTGAVLVVGYVFLLRYDLSLTPLAIGLMSLLHQVREAALSAESSALAGSIAGIVATLAVTWWLYHVLRSARDRAVV